MLTVVLCNVLFNAVFIICVWLTGQSNVCQRIFFAFHITFKQIIKFLNPTELNVS